jgi:hypothetical protein
MYPIWIQKLVGGVKKVYHRNLLDEIPFYVKIYLGILLDFMWLYFSDGPDDLLLQLVCISSVKVFLVIVMTPSKIPSLLTWDLYCTGCVRLESYVACSLHCSFM